ncbi:MAG: isoaspartyl peptidase/L-asparaginase [Rhodoferax sp.]|nr:isoaspartyl peptidase/L-asparaginase [Rhodoferax sp.]
MSITPVIAIHGGAGTILRASMNPKLEADYRRALQDVLRAGAALLAGGASALDAVTEAVRLLEECALFNAGKGAVYTDAGTHEMDACVMDGATLAAGAVAGVTRVRNPVLAARAVMAHSGHVLMIGPAAQEFVARHGVELVAPDWFATPERHAQWLRARQQAGTGSGAVLLDHDAASLAAPLDPDSKFGTVGAVALDAHGHLAAATSTGGVTNKRVGRVGDSPIVGAGCYANHLVAVSTTGTGEMFMRAVTAHDVCALMEYAGLSLQAATQRVIMDKLPHIGGRGGLIAVDAQGQVALPFNTEGMYRGYARVGGEPVCAIYGADNADPSTAMLGPS